MTMATEHMSPLVVRKNNRPAGHTAAAPLFVLLALLLAAFSGSPVAVAVDSSPELVELTLVAGAEEKGAGILS
jgi:hypothetical protein